jgi:hypothetical protein
LVSRRIKIIETDQYFTDEEASGGYCSSTPGQYKAKGGVAAPENEDARANQRRAEKIQRLVQLYSELDLAGLSAMQRAPQEQEMLSVYQAFDEEWLDKSLAAAGSGEEQTPPSDEDIILQRRPALGHAKSTSNDESRHVQNSSTEEPASDAVTRLNEIKARAAERLQAIRDYLD